MISRKVIVSVILMLFFASSVLGAKMIQNEGQLLAYLNEKKFIQDIRVNEVKINDAYILQNGVVYVPLKKIVLTLQEEYQYSKKDNWVVITTPKEKFKLLLNSSQYFIGNKVYNYKTNENLNEVKPIFTKGRIYAPLQFVEEIFSIKQVGKALYIENKTKSFEAETEIQKETISVIDETEQPLENIINETKSNDINEDKSSNSTYKSNKSKSKNTTKRKKKKKKSSLNQSNTTPQQQQNSADENQIDNVNQSENVNESNSESNNSNQGLNEEPTEAIPVEEENTPVSEPVSELN